jgi:hypothetical protein
MHVERPRAGKQVRGEEIKISVTLFITDQKERGDAVVAGFEPQSLLAKLKFSASSCET